MSHTHLNNTGVMRPLPAGAVIDFCGERAIVMHDHGDDSRLTVAVGGYEERWWWTFEER